MIALLPSEIARLILSKKFKIVSEQNSTLRHTRLFGRGKFDQDV